MEQNTHRHRWLLLPPLLLGVSLAAVFLPKQTTTQHRQPIVNASKANLAETYGKLPMLFEANNGQTDEQVKFIARGRGYTLFLTSSESVFVLSGKEASTTLRMQLVDANAETRVQAEDNASTTVNYFAGTDSTKWRTNIPTSKRVRYSQVYPGIDLVFYGNQRELEYDLLVAPGADFRQIALAFNGAEKVEIEEATGDLLLHTSVGVLRQHQPSIYQETDGRRTKIAGHYIQRPNNLIGFEVTSYDAMKALVIDPTLVYSTYLGGTPPAGGGVNGDTLSDIAVDTLGNTYLVGTTESADFPVTPGALKTSFGNANTLGYITKLNASGTTLVYSTYLNASPGGITVDSTGNAYVTGSAGSTFPATAGSYRSTPVGVLGNAFVLKLNPSGSGLVFATFVGGTGNPGSMSMIAGGDFGRSIAVDTAGNSYIAGYTFSHDFPVTIGAIQTSNPSTNAVSQRTGFVAKVNAAGTDLVYSTYLGGTGTDQASGIAVDSDGNAYVTGTASRDFPTTTGAFMTTYPERSSAYITKFNPAGTGLVYSTYLGGSAFGGTDGEAIALDTGGNAYITGTTESTNYPTTIGSFNRFGCGGTDKGFVTKLNAAGTDLVYSTYLCAVGASSGGNSTGVFDIGVDASGNAVVTGYTTGDTFPLTSDAYQNQLDGSESPFLTKFNAAGSALTYSTFFGGHGFDIGLAIALDPSGNVYIAGETDGMNFPTTPGAYQTTYAGGDDVFVAKFNFGATAPGRLLNISTRTKVLTGDNVLIGGFIITGTAPREVVIRATGPSIETNGTPLAGTLQDPTLSLRDGSGTEIEFNDDWGSAPEPERTEIQNSGLKPDDAREPAILRSLNPGAYTVIVSGKGGATGIALVEIYDRDPVAARPAPAGIAPIGSRLANLSSRAFCSTEDNIMIGGAIVGGSSGGGVRTLVRALGPSLKVNGTPVAGRMTDPRLELFDANGVSIATNDNWKSDQQQEIEGTGLAPEEDAEAAIVVELPAGATTAQLRGSNNSSGVALIEFYELPQSSGAAR